MTVETVSVRFAGRDHPVLVQAPGTRGAGATPLVLLLHGSGSNAHVIWDKSGLRDHAAAVGMAVVAPQAATPLDTGDGHPDGGWAWHVPGVPFVLDGAAPARDDISFLLQVAQSLSAELGTDPHPVIVGFSGGARMASAVAGVAPALVRGIAAVAGLRAGRAAGPGLRQAGAGELHPGPPVPVLAFHGSDDPVNPYAGDGLPRWGYSVEHAARAWAHRNGVPVEPEVSRVAPCVELRRYGAGRPGEVALYTTEGDGHTWPGSPTSNPLLGHQTDQISATGLIIDFVETSAHRPAPGAAQGRAHV